MLFSKCLLFSVILCGEFLSTLGIFANGVLNINLFRCITRQSLTCPHQDVVFRMYNSQVPRGRKIDVRYPKTFKHAGYYAQQETVFIVHGFNGTESDRHIRYLRDAYVSREFNVITVNWQELTVYPCYLTALTNTRLVAQCTAQIYAFLTYRGQPNKMITCVGHSLGAHICGMMSNHLSTKQHKIIGLDPARPLIENKASAQFRLTRDDANVVQIIHTNSGGLGQVSRTGSVDFCINGGKMQPFCHGHLIRRARCSHFLSVCYLANALFKHKQFLAVPCPYGCLKIKSPNRLPLYADPETNLITPELKYMHIGQDTSEDIKGTYCIQVDFAKHCPFNDQ